MLSGPLTIRVPNLDFDYWPFEYMNPLGCCVDHRVLTEIKMRNTQKVITAIVVLTFSASILAYQDQDTDGSYERSLDFALRQFLRYKREDNSTESLEVKEESDSAQEITQIEKPETGDKEKDDPKSEEQEKVIKELLEKAKNKTEEKPNHEPTNIAKLEDVLSRALILQSLESLQKPQETQNATESEEHTRLPKRQIAASAASAVGAGEVALATSAATNVLNAAEVALPLGSSFLAEIPLAELDALSCEAEALEYGHEHPLGIIIHELFCEIRKLWHYILIALRNLRAELSVGPQTIINEYERLQHSESVLTSLLERSPLLLEALIKDPQHLLTLPDIVRDSVPFASISATFRRLREVFQKAVTFSRHLFSLVSTRHLDNLINDASILYEIHEKLSALEKEELELLDQYVNDEIALSSTTVSSVADSVFGHLEEAKLPLSDYLRVLKEVTTSIRGVYDGFHASGMAELIRSGVETITSSSTTTALSSTLSRIPFVNTLLPEEEEEVTTSVASATSVTTTAAEVVPSFRPVLPVEAETRKTTTTTTTVTETDTAVPVAPALPVVSALPVAPAASETTVSSLRTNLRKSLPRLFNRVTPLVSETAAASSTSVSSSDTVIAEPAVTTAVVEKNTVTRTETVDEVVAPSAPLVAPSAAATAVSNAVSTSTGETASASASASETVSSSPVRFPLTILSRLSPKVSATPVAEVSSSSTVSTVTETDTETDVTVSEQQVPQMLPRIVSSVVPQQSAASTSSTSTSSTVVSDSTVDASYSGSPVSVSRGLSLPLILPREKVVSALGHDFLLPGDIIAITLRNKAVLFGRVMDTASPINFNILKPKISASILKNGGRIWNLLPKDFHDPDCEKQFNNPLLLAGI